MMTTTHPPLPALAALPLGAIRATGWTAAQLRQQVAGMAGHLDEHWPPVRDSAWIGGAADGWERGPYWLDGIVPLAHLTGDPGLLAKVSRWIDHLLAHQAPDGWMGPDDGDPDGPIDVTGRDVWPRAVLLKVFLQQHSATSDARLIPAMLRLCGAISQTIRHQPLTGWARYRASELMLSLQALHGLTGAQWLLEMADEVCSQGYPWREFAGVMPTDKVDLAQIERWREESGLQLPDPAMATHGVNVAMGLKAMPVEWLSSGDDALRDDLTMLLSALDRHHGLPNGLFSADEHLAGTHPSQGSETCAVVEQLFSLETALRIWGPDEDLLQRWERIAFNALPAAATAVDDAHQYDQQANQVVCHVTEDRIYSDNGPDANLFGLEPHFGCCTANRHQGWPKVVASLWARDTRDGALTALSYAPAIVTCPAGDGASVRVEVSGDFPFSDEVLITVTADRPTRQRLRLRVPGWALAPELTVAGSAPLALRAGTYHDVDIECSASAQRIRLSLPAPVRQTRHADGSVTVDSGPLVFVYPIDERWEQVVDRGWMADWAVRPGHDWAVGVAGAAGSRRVDGVAAPTDSPFHKGRHRLAVPVPVRPVAGWEMEHGAAARPPADAVATGPVREAAFIPYGAARLRLTALPVVEEI